MHLIKLHAMTWWLS